MSASVGAVDEVKIDILQEPHEELNEGPPLAIMPTTALELKEENQPLECKKHGQCYNLCNRLFKDVISQVPLTVLALSSGGYGVYQVLSQDNIVPGLFITAGAVFQLLACCRIGALKPLYGLDKNVRLLEEQVELRQAQNEELEERNAYFKTTVQNLHRQTFDYKQTIAGQNQSLNEARLELQGVVERLNDKIAKLQLKLRDYNILIQEVTRLVSERDGQNEDAKTNLEELAQVVQGLEEFKECVCRKQLEIKEENEEYASLNQIFSSMLENLKNHMSTLTHRFEHQKKFISSLNDKMNLLFQAQEKEGAANARLEELQKKYTQLALQFQSILEEIQKFKKE